jgi:hypothetical protein
MGFAIMPGGILVLQNFIFWALMFGLYIYFTNGLRLYTLAIASVPALHFSIQLVNDFIFTSADHEIRFRTFIFVVLSIFLLVDSKARSVLDTR